MRTGSNIVLALVASGALCSAVAGQTIQVIYSEIAGDPTSVVPPGAGVPAGTLFDSLDRPYRSPDGLLWIISASTNLATSEDEIIIVGAGATGTTEVREGTAFGSPTVGELVGLIDRNLSITDTGAYTFATNTNGPTTSDEYIVLYSIGAGTWIAAAQEGQPVPTMPTEAYGTTLNSGFVLDDGVTVGFRAPSTVGTLGLDFDDFLIRGAGIVAQEGTTIPGNQAGGGSETWDVFDSEDFYGSATGASYIAQGDLTGSTTTDDVVVVDDDVVVQEGSPIAGSSFFSAVETILEIAMSSNGDWFARGDNVDQQDWVVRNGAVVGARGEPIVLGSTELFDDTAFSATFFWMAGNNNGDFVIGGTTNNPDVEADAVLVLNGTTIVARQGDPVDLDGNGVYDDNVFIEIFNNDDGFLTDGGLLYFTGDIVDGSGLALGQALLQYDVTGLESCLGDMVPVPADGNVNIQDLLALLGQWGSCPLACATGCPGDLNGDCVVDIVDLLILLGNWGTCP